LPRGDTAIKRRLRLELAAAHGSDDVAREVKKRLAIIAKAHAFIEWPKIKAVVADLELQRRTIAEQVMKINAAQALDLMWEFLGLANSILNRCDDSNGVVGHVFRTALEDLARLANEVRPAPESLAEQTYAALIENHFGQYDGLVEALSQALGRQGLKHLKARFIELSNRAVPKPVDSECVPAWNKDPVFGVIGIQSGPR
jgi:hypothetical protein